MAAMAESSSGAAMADAGDGPVMSMMNKRLRALRKKYNRILQMEERVALGKSLNKEQEEVLRSKESIAVLIEEYEKIRSPLSAALQEELSLGRTSSPTAAVSAVSSEETKAAEDFGDAASPVRGAAEPQGDPETAVEDLLKLLYFGCLFDVKSQNEFASMVFTRTHERECCLTYDYVTDDSTGFLQEGDLNLLSALGSLIISRPANSSVSHKDALLGCLEHAKLWLRNSGQSIQPESPVTYTGLRERLNRILSSDYFTTTPELKAPVDVAAAVEKYAAYQVQVPDSAPQPPLSQIDDPPAQYEGEEDRSEDNYQVTDPGYDQFNEANDSPKDESDVLDSSDINPVQHEQHAPQEDELSQKDAGLIEQQHYAPRRSFQPQRVGGRGLGRRGGYGNGRGGSRGGRGGGGYQNGRAQFYDPGYYPRSYYNPRGRGGRGGPSTYNNHGGAPPGGRFSGNIELGASS